MDALNIKKKKKDGELEEAWLLIGTVGVVMRRGMKKRKEEENFLGERKRC